MEKLIQELGYQYMIGQTLFKEEGHMEVLDSLDNPNNTETIWVIDEIVSTVITDSQYDVMLSYCIIKDSIERKLDNLNMQDWIDVHEALGEFSMHGDINSKIATWDFLLSI